MRALLARGPGRFSVEDLPEPPLPEQGVVVEVEAAGVCASDRMLWNGQHPWGTLPWPFVPGHELLGRVVTSVREDVPLGTRVTAEVMVACGSCQPCVRGRENLCRNGRHLGSDIPGAFAEQLALPAAARLHEIPEELSLEAGVLAEPAACAVHAVARSGVQPGQQALVVGLGAIGSLAVVAAQAAGAEVVVATRARHKAQLLEDLDTRWVDEGDVPDVVVECSGAPDGVATALDLVAPGGVVVLYSVFPSLVRVDLNLVAEHKELDVRGGHLAPGAFPAGIALLADPRVEAITTDVHLLDDWQRALDPVPRSRSGSRTGAAAPRLKAVLVP